MDAPILEDQELAGLQLVDSEEPRPGRRHVLEREVGDDCLGIRASINEAACENRTWLAAVDEAAIHRRPVEGLYAEAVAGKKQPRPPCIPQCDREHAL